jgi:hypothetical protein
VPLAKSDEHELEFSQSFFMKWGSVPCFQRSDNLMERQNKLSGFAIERTYYCDGLDKFQGLARPSRRRQECGVIYL